MFDGVAGHDLEYPSLLPAILVIPSLLPARSEDDGEDVNFDCGYGNADADADDADGDGDTLSRIVSYFAS